MLVWQEDMVNYVKNYIQHCERGAFFGRSFVKGSIAKVLRKEMFMVVLVLQELASCIIYLHNLVIYWK